MNSKQLEALVRIHEYEERVPADKRALGWTWQDVKVHSATLNALLLADMLDIVFKSNSMTGYQLTEKGKAAAVSTDAAGEELDDDELVIIPDTIFSPIVGHDNVKRLLGAALRAPKPVHVLLLGPPALAKSLFLWDVEQVYGGRALWVIGSALSQAGLWDLVSERRPQVILIDELDKLRGPDQAALLSLMEGGRLTRAKAGGRRLEIQTEPLVLAAANRTTGLSGELLSRFAVREVLPYNTEQFKQVVRQVLVTREGLDEKTAEEVSAALQGLTQDVRDAIRVARLAGTLDVNEAVELLGLGSITGNQSSLFA